MPATNHTFTLGIEEEFAIIDPETRELRSHIQEILQKVEQGVLTLNQYLGYDLNTVEFAIRDGVPFAIDFCNPAPDSEAASVGQANFEWVVDAVSDMAIRKAKEHQPGKDNLSWGKFMQAAVMRKSLGDLA